MVALPLEKEGIIKERLKLEHEGLNLVIRKKLLDTEVVEQVIEGSWAMSLPGHL